MDTADTYEKYSVVNRPFVPLHRHRRHETRTVQVRACVDGIVLYDVRMTKDFIKYNQIATEERFDREYVSIYA